MDAAEGAESALRPVIGRSGVAVEERGLLKRALAGPDVTPDMSASSREIS